MTDRELPARPRTVDSFRIQSSLDEAVRTASTVRAQWQSGQRPDLASVLEAHPELKNHRTIVLNLAYDEFRLRRKAGESVDAGEFSQRFQSLERSLFFFIAMHSLVETDPEFAGTQTDTAWPEPGSHFLGFDLIAEIGRGALGRVFLATERALGQRRVVVKVAIEGTHEAEILARLQHPNIVPIYSIEEDPATGLTGFCMPYWGESTLASVIDTMYAGPRRPARAKAILDAVRAANEHADLPEPLPADGILRKGSYVEGVIHLGVQLAEALAYAHAQGIFHRDLKPSNILMSPEGRPLLLDFNLSVDDRHPIWRIGGTLPYMAAEELEAVRNGGTGQDSRRYDARADVFSLGVVLYELLTGDLPFGKLPCNQPAEEVAAEMCRRQAEGPRGIRQRNGQVDKRVARLIESCLAVDPAHRPSDAESLAAALRKELSLGRRAVRRVKAHPRKMAAVTLLGAMLVTATSLYFAFRPPYSIRQFRQGLAYAEQGRDDLAVECYSSSLWAAPKSSEVLAARARACERLGDFRMAYQDYRTAHGLTPAPLLNASRAYCLNQIGEHREAIMIYRQLLTAGEEWPAVLNNLGHSLLRTGDLDEAESVLRRAIRGDDSMQAAHHNLTLVFSKRAVQGKAIPPEAFVHAQRAIETGPASGDLYQALASLYSVAAKRNATYRQRAIEYVQRAVSLGINPQVFKTDPFFAGSANDPAFQRALAAPRQSQAAVRAVFFIHPSFGAPSE